MRPDCRIPKTRPSRPQQRSASRFPRRLTSEVRREINKETARYNYMAWGGCGR